MESFETRWTLGDCLELGSFRNINGVTIWVLGTRGGKICLWPPCRDAGIENIVVGDEQQSIWIFVTWYNWKWQVVFWVMLWYWHSEVADSWRDHQRKAPDLRARRRFSDPGDSSFQGAIWYHFSNLLLTLSWCLTVCFLTGAVNFITSQQLTTSFSSKSGESQFTISRSIGWSRWMWMYRCTWFCIYIVSWLMFPGDHRCWVMGRVNQARGRKQCFFLAKMIENDAMSSTLSCVIVFFDAFRQESISWCFWLV